MRKRKVLAGILSAAMVLSVMPAYTAPVVMAAGGAWRTRC